MNLSQTMAIQSLKANVAGTQATTPDSRASDQWVKNYLDAKSKRLNDTRERLNNLMVRMHHIMEPPEMRGLEDGKGHLHDETF